ncbi:hypothetical protein WJX72_004491 [[Myrmecia] bisecta]|uniref:Acid phosphatase n=1 Tax=[Myrmecia] bisecta TaxID=41462 RepID=A0AAW1QEU5_9CHLO
MTSLETSPLAGAEWQPSADPEDSKPSLARRTGFQKAFIGWICGAAFTAALLSNVVWLIATRDAASAPGPPPAPAPAPVAPPPEAPADAQYNCLYALGGGATPNGGSFPQQRVQLPPCTTFLKQYLTMQYDKDVDLAIAYARAYFDGLSGVPSPSQLIVFDIDETALSNRAEWLYQLNTGFHSRWERGSQVVPQAPPLNATRHLYLDLLDRGFSTSFITGRSEGGGAREATASNLEAAGYGRPCYARDQRRSSSSPCYVKLDMRAAGDSRLASIYKPERRQMLQDEGYELVGAFGDQWSDLAGLAPAIASFKLPNPMYYIL